MPLARIRTSTLRMFPELEPSETGLTGQWIVAGAKVQGEEVERRTEWLLAERLERLAADWSGWEGLSRDRRDGRLWELTFPQGEMQGGGPRRLHVVVPDVAAARCRLPAV